MALEAIQLVTAAELLDYLGAGSESSAIVEGLRTSALAQLAAATGIDWTDRTDCGVANEALRVMVWLSFYSMRDDKAATEHLERYKTSLIKSLQYAVEVTADAAKG